MPGPPYREAVITERVVVNRIWPQADDGESYVDMSILEPDGTRSCVGFGWPVAGFAKVDFVPRPGQRFAITTRSTVWTDPPPAGEREQSHAGARMLELLGIADVEEPDPAP